MILYDDVPEPEKPIQSPDDDMQIEPGAQTDDMQVLHRDIYDDIQRCRMTFIMMTLRQLVAT